MWAYFVFRKWVESELEQSKRATSVASILVGRIVLEAT